MADRIITEDVLSADLNELLEDIAARDSEGLQDEVLFRRILEMKRLDSFRGQRAENKLESRSKELKSYTAISRLYKAYKVNEARRISAVGGNTTRFTEQPIVLSCGEWVADDSGIRKTVSNRMGDIETKLATKTPLLITEIYKNVEAVNDVEKVRIAYRDGGIWRSTVVSNSVICESRNITQLSGLGIDVTSNTAKLLVDYFQCIKTGNQSVIPVRASIGRMGWTEDGGFSPYSGLVFDGESEYRQIYDAVRERGDFEAWKREMSELRKNRYFRLQMAAAFAAPLLQKLDILSFILHYHGGTDTGKTVGMMCAMSVWGDPRPGKMWRTLNNTTNYLMQVSGTLCNIPVALDELQTIKSTMGYDTLIMRLCAGADRGRMNSGRTLDEVKTWRTAFITTGEEPIVKENSGGGSINRVVEIDCNDKYIIPPGEGNRIVNFISENYGYAGKALIDALSDYNGLKGLYTNYFEKLLTAANAPEKQASAMAAMLTGDAIAVMFIFDGEEALLPEDVTDLLADRKTVDVTERAYNYVMDMIASNTFKFNNDYGECWGRINADDTVMINKSVLLKLMGDNGFDFNACKKKWAAKGYLELNSQGKYIHCTKCNNVKGYFVKLRQRIEEEPAINKGDPPF